MQGARGGLRRLVGALWRKTRPTPRQVRAYRNRPGFLVSSVEGRPTVVRAVSAVEPWRLSAELAERVQETLDALGVEYWAAQPLQTRITQWSIRSSDAAAVVAAVSADLVGEGYYLKRAGVPPALITRRKSSTQVRGTAIELFQYVVDATGVIYSDYAKCQLLCWEASERGSLRTSARSAVIHELADTQPIRTVSVRNWRGCEQPRPEVLAEPDASEVAFDVDAVYLWVDDSDPVWRARRDAAYREHFGEDRSDSQAKAAIRYRDRGELRASMRSLEMYAPWIRRIFLVTDQQRPHWLTVDDPRITLVDHREIFQDHSLLPTFNSHAISAQLHHIPGLSEHYLLMNDDVLFNLPVAPSDFFTPDGSLKLTFSRSRRPQVPTAQLTALEKARANSARILERDFGRPVTQLFAHVPVSQSIAIAQEVSERYADEIAQTLAHPFRSAEDYVVGSWLCLYTALFTGRGVKSDLGFAYFDVGEPADRARMESSTRYMRAAVICANDTVTQTDDASSEWLASWLGRRYPVPTRWELLDDLETHTSQRLGSG